MNMTSQKYYYDYTLHRTPTCGEASFTQDPWASVPEVVFDDVTMDKFYSRLRGFLFRFLCHYTLLGFYLRRNLVQWLIDRTFQASFSGRRRAFSRTIRGLCLGESGTAGLI